jgi:hypothetical protein
VLVADTGWGDRSAYLRHFRHVGRLVVRSNVIRDLAALNKIELLPWDAWGLAEDWSQINTEPDNLVIDSLAATCASEDLTQAQHRFTDDRFAVPETITSFIEGVPTKIAWHPAKWQS